MAAPGVVAATATAAVTPAAAAATAAELPLPLRRHLTRSGIRWRHGGQAAAALWGGT
ncbi:hypothetical protein JW613_12510 [Streptomyces smyrnaeus]|uniref:Uncharacterized protein n=1 Tax=Streptomyces smyrnaeus TaxID=1387713 RepID=A0ABS3XUP4_9ACTN|nr:hypothetical protein [Streptomyces smyrnaeus]MBO8199123.1 hypothetical protein [Streptomyces smyrnaeus]